MAGRLLFRPATVDIALGLADTMRACDREELEAASPLSIAEQLELSVRYSAVPAAAFTEDNELVAVFGAAPYNLLGDTAAPWLLASDLFKRFPVASVKAARRFFLQTEPYYPKLVNYVYERNSESIAWLIRVGFVIDPPAPFGHKGLNFHRFHRGLKNV